MDTPRRIKTLQGVVIVIAAIVLLRLFYIQVLDGSYKTNADNNVLRYMVQYPPRGEVYDRNGRFLVQSKEAYDLMATPREVRPFDTALMSRILGVPVEQIRKELIKASNFSRRRASVIVKQLPKETKLRLEEHQFPGFFTVYRTVRSYPTKMAGNLLGYVGEVDDRILERDPYYRSGDYIGRSGIEQAYEEVLRGEKGVKIEMVDVHGIPKGSYANGIYDTLPSPGVAITCTIDARLQALAEELMEGKVGSVVAIEPETGEILVMANSPTYDPDELVGRDRGNNYMKLLNDPRRPLYNRAVMSFYPPGSTFKVIQGLIGMQEGVLSPSQTYPCHGGYPYGRGVKCHAHGSPLDLEAAIANSCNAYFCYVFRNIIENKKYKNIEEGFGVWADYVRSFGYGRKLGQGLPGPIERTHRDLAVDRAGRAGLHPVADGQHGGYGRQPGPLPHSARGQADTRPRLDRRAVLRQPHHPGGRPLVRTDRRRDVPSGQRRRNGPDRDGAGPGYLRQDRYGSESARGRQQHILLLRPAKQPEDSRLGLHRKRGIRRHRRSPDRQPADRALPHRYDPARAAGGIRQKQTDRLPVL